MTHFPSESHIEFVQLCSFPPFLPHSHLCCTTCCASGTVKETISPNHLLYHNAYALILQYLSGQLLCGLAVCLGVIWAEGYGYFAEMKLFCISIFVTPDLVKLILFQVHCLVRSHVLWLYLVLWRRFLVFLVPEVKSWQFLGNIKKTFYKKDSILIP